MYQAGSIDPRALYREKRKDFQITQASRLRYRTRYFTDSGIIGSKEFVSVNYRRFKHLFVSKHKKKPKPIQGWRLFCHVVYPAGTPENFRFCVAEGSNQSSLFELRPDKVKNYDFTLRRLDSEALRCLQRWGLFITISTIRKSIKSLSPLFC